jgi:predicted RNase H-like HicB family nuclease
MLEVTFKAHIEPRPGGGFVARFLVLEDCVCEGNTRKEVEVKAKTVLTAYLRTLRTHDLRSRPTHCPNGLHKRSRSAAGGKRFPPDAPPDAPAGRVFQWTFPVHSLYSLCHPHTMRRTNLGLACGIAAITLLLASCLIPETFTATVRLAKDGTYVFEYKGTVGFAPGLMGIAENKGKLSPADEVKLRAATAEMFPEKDGFESASYEGNARYKIHFKREGRQDKQFAYMFSQTAPFLTLERLKDGSVRLTGMELKKEDSAQLNAIQFKISGSLEVTTDCDVTTQNATATADAKNGFKAYKWKITSDKLAVPQMVLTSPSLPPLAATPATRPAARAPSTTAPATAPQAAGQPARLFIIDGDKRTELKPVVISGRQGKMNSREATLSVMPGPKAAVRLSSREPVFELLVGTNTGFGAKVFIVLLNTSDTERYTEPVTLNLETGVPIGNAAFWYLSFKPVNGGATLPPGLTAYRARTPGRLVPGEYWIQWLGVPKAFDFGIDRGR